MATTSTRFDVGATETAIVPNTAFTNVVIQNPGGEIYVGPTGVTRGTGLRVTKDGLKLGAVTASQLFAISADPAGKVVGVTVLLTT
jgi:hypothetical protein